MAKIEVTLGGKGVGIADQASIEPAKGCNNGCAGCYAAKTTRMGSKFGNMEPREYDDDKFRRSCKSAYKKGIRFVRMAKHCDPGDPALRGTVVQILQAATDENLRVVFVTKSLSYDKEVADKMKEGKHILHVSLGMKVASEDGNLRRLRTYRRYKDMGKVISRVRICEDVTKEMPSHYRGMTDENVIITPMRFSSKEHAAEYEADLEKYEWNSGYYRPKMRHASWIPYSNWCGEVGKDIYCSNCLVEETNGM